MDWFPGEHHHQAAADEENTLDPTAFWDPPGRKTEHRVARKMLIAELGHDSVERGAGEGPSPPRELRVLSEVIQDDARELGELALLAKEPLKSTSRPTT